VKRVVLLGGGHSHLEVVRRFGANPVGNAEISLVDPAQFATYSGMLPGLIAGHYSFSDCHVDLARLALRCGVRYLPLRACGMDIARRQIALSDGTLLDYDIASLDVGSTPPTAGVPGAAEHAVAAKPFTVFAQRWDRLIAAAQAGTLRKVVVIGGGAAGVELALAMHYRLAQATMPHPIDFTVVTDAQCLLPDHNRQTRAALERALTQRGIAVYLNSRVTRVETTQLILRGTAHAVASDATIWATGAGAPSWLANTGLALDVQDFMRIDERLVSVSNPEIFAAGDCATIDGHRYPKSGVYAVRQGPVLAENLRRVLAGEHLARYRPQQRALALISTGNRYAVASYGRYALEGAWVWRWKDYIDRKFMRRYRA
jgi:selenide,water dikinase